MTKKIEEKIIIYQSPNGSVELRADIQQDTVWASLIQISELFDTDKSGVSRHINNIYKSGELSKKGTVANFAIVQQEGNRKIARNVEHFSLDVILSVGYRINSKKATHFRQWATKTLKDHIPKQRTAFSANLKRHCERSEAIHLSSAA